MKKPCLMVGVTASDTSGAEVMFAQAGAIAKADSQIAMERVYIFVFKPFCVLAFLFSANIRCTIWLTTYCVC